ncbi:MAG: hypothetical protein M0P91_04610 [Sulfuricurvum sp.]|jgi:hypothetical protein|uniref:hypothetical protein n=1 Tax=Sulfuricurvum sp. TaxID=2025608 RepID=UPI0025FB182E|nr:hypothetical protein [Sulfuricurvum sp.]MCK9372457.1 hypothetical protein [Sulfuricurvum sp.]
MKKIIIMSLLASIAAFSATPKETAIAEKSLLLGMHIQENKEQIVDLGRFAAFKELQKQIENVDCNIKASENSDSEYLRGLCSFINKKQNNENHKETLEAMNTLAYAALSSKKPKYYCSFALALYTTNEWNKADYILRKVSAYGNDEVCDIARNIPKNAIKKSLNTSKDASNECAIQK